VTGVFKANNPTNAFVLFFYGLLLKLPTFLHPVVPQPQLMDGFLYKLLLKWLAPIGNGLPLLYPLLTYLLLFTQALAFNRLVSGQRLLQRPNYLTGMAYLLITSVFADWGKLSSPLIINTILIWVWARMSSLHTETNAKTTLFNIGFAIGLCTFFYFPSIAFAVLIVAGLAITRPFKLAEWIIALLGILTPYYFLLAYVFLTDKIKGYRFPGVAFTSPQFVNTPLGYTAIGLILLLLAMGFFYVQQNKRKQLIQTRKSWNLIFLYLLAALLVPFINATNTFEYWILCAVPFSVLVGAGFFYPAKKWVPMVMHWALVGLIVAMMMGWR
jgi:Family of unknown function (DUF6427)